MTSISTRELTNDFLVDCDATTDLFCMYAVCCTSHVVYFLQSFLRTTIIKSISPTIQYWLHVVLPYKKVSTGTLLYSIFSFSAQEASEKTSVLSWECYLTDTAMNYVHNQIIEAKQGGFGYNMHSKPELCLTQTQSMHLYKQMLSSLPQMAPCYWDGASWTQRRALNRGVWRISAQPGG